MTIPPWQFSRAYTPELIKRLIQITAGTTLGVVALDQYLGLQQYLAVTPYLFERGYFWQCLTSLFLIPSVVFSFGFLLDVAFSMLILWLFGSLLLERIGKKKFVFFYLATGILSGLAGAYVLHMLGLYFMFSSLFPVLLALTTLWTMADPYQEILLFFILPLKAKWALAFALFGTVFASFVQKDLVSLAAYSTAFLFSYFYGLFALGFRSPYDWMLGLDRLVHKGNSSVQRIWQWYLLAPIRRFIDGLRRFKANNRAKEEGFIDSTLDKISKDGTSSLSLYERLRLKWISLKKRMK